MEEASLVVVLDGVDDASDVVVVGVVVAGVVLTALLQNEGWEFVSLT